MADITENGSVVRPAIREKDLAYLILSNDQSSNQGIPHGLLMAWDDGSLDTFAPSTSSSLASLLDRIRHR